MELKKDKYKGYNITAIEHEKCYYRITYRNGEFLMDKRTVEGEVYQGLNHAINDAKREIDILERLKELKSLVLEN